MKKSEFLKELEEILQREEPCNAGDALNDYDEWDSLSKMAVMAFYGKEFNIKVTLNDIKNLETVEDLIKLAGSNINA